MFPLIGSHLGSNRLASSPSPAAALWRVLLSLLADPNIVGHRVLDDAKATKAQGYQQRRGDMRESYYAFVPRRVRETRPASRRHPTDGEAFSEL